jgi:isopenicillin N synthase-like dioxygenase
LTTPFPTIELARADASTPGAVDRICRETGFLAVSGHGIPPALVADVLRVSREFFDLPLEKKMRVAMPFTGYPYGYSPFAKEALAQSYGGSTPPDLKESFSIGPEETWKASAWNESRGFEGAPTLWPEEPRDLTDVYRRYFTEMGMLSSRILSVFALALDLQPDFFASKVDRHASALRALNYPPHDEPPRPGQLRAGAHTDYGSLTILLAEPGSRGLEIRHPSGEWQSVPIEEGAFIVNIGDLMARWANDRWVSTVHRCSCEMISSRRQSVAFFHLPNWDAEIRAIPTCVPEGSVARYPPVLAGEYLMGKFRSAVQLTTED